MEHTLEYFCVKVCTAIWPTCALKIRGRVYVPERARPLLSEELRARTWHIVPKVSILKTLLPQCFCLSFFVEYIYKYIVVLYFLVIRERLILVSTWTSHTCSGQWPEVECRTLVYKTKSNEIIVAWWGLSWFCHWLCWDVSDVRDVI